MDKEKQMTKRTRLLHPALRHPSTLLRLLKAPTACQGLVISFANSKSTILTPWLHGRPAIAQVVHRVMMTPAKCSKLVVSRRSMTLLTRPRLASCRSWSM